MGGKVEAGVTGKSLVIEIKGFTVEELKIADNNIPYVKAIVETPEETKKVSLHIHVDDIPDIIKDRVKLVSTIVDALKNEGMPIDMESIIRITSKAEEIASKLKETYRRYYYGLTGVRVKELEEKLVPKAKVYIEKQLRTEVYSYLIVLHELGKKPIIVGYGGTPKQQYELIKAFQHMDISTENVLEQIGLKEVDIKKLRVYTKEYPYLLAYKSGNVIILSREPLPRGEVSLRLRVPSREELRKIFEEIPDLDAENLVRDILNVIGVNYNSFVKSLGRREEIELATILENFLDEYGSRLRIGERGLDKEYVDHYMSDWSDYVKRAFELIDGDPLILAFYKGMALPYYRPEWSPHTLIITSTNAGKTLLYRLFTGRDPLSDVTPRTLVGHYSLEERRVAKGILHGKHIAIQIEGLESKTARDTLALLIDYMKSGIACRGVQREICVEGTAPIILTGNTVKTKKKAYTLQNWIKLGLLDNPEALSSRLLLFYKDTKKLQVKNLKELKKLWEIIREIRDSSVIKYKLRQIWDLPQIEEWIETPDRLEVEITVEEELSDIGQYLNGLKENFYTRLRALALNNVLLDYLDQIHFNNLDYLVNTLLPEILEKAQDVYEILRAELVYSIRNIQYEYGFKDPTLIALSLPKPYRQLLISINNYLNAKAMNKELEAIDIDDLMEFMKSEGVKNTNVLKYKITKKLWTDTIDRLLRILGVYIVFSGDKVIVKVDTTTFNTLDFSRIVESF